MEDHASKLKGLVWVLAACLCGILFAAGISPLAHLIPWSWEKALGNTLSMDLNAKDLCNNPKAEALLQRIVQRLYPLGPEDKDFSIEVKVIHDPVVNAYAGLGGEIRINTGLLQKAGSPEEIAGVLAHEIEHVHHRHIMEGALVHLFTIEGVHLIFGDATSAASFARYFLNMNFTRSQESQADEDGLKRLQKAHISNLGFKRFFERMEKENSTPVFLSDHPADQTRMEMVDRFKNEDDQPLMTSEEWAILKNYCW